MQITPYDKQVEILKLRADGKSLDVIANEVSVHRSSVYQVIKKGKAHRHIHRKLYDCSLQEMFDDYAAGMKPAELTVKYNISYSGYWRRLRTHGLVKPMSEANRRYPLNENAFNNSADPETAYWIGMLMADGSISIRKNDQRCVHLDLKDIEHLDKFKSFLKTTIPIHIHKNNGYGTGSDIGRVIITSKIIVNELAKYGVLPNKSFTAEVKLLENNLHFWRGMIDGDGWVTFGKYPVIGLTGSKVMMQQFVDFAKPICGKELTIGPNHSVWKVTTTGTYAVKLIKHLYDNDHVSLNRKKETAVKAMEWKRTLPDRSEWTLGYMSSMKEQFGTWANVGKELGVSAHACAVRYSRFNRRGV